MHHQQGDITASGYDMKRSGTYPGIGQPCQAVQPLHTGEVGSLREILIDPDIAVDIVQR